MSILSGLQIPPLKVSHSSSISKYNKITWALPGIACLKHLTKESLYVWATSRFLFVGTQMFSSFPCFLEQFCRSDSDYPPPPFMKLQERKLVESQAWTSDWTELSWTEAQDRRSSPSRCMPSPQQTNLTCCFLKQQAAFQLLSMEG